MNDLNKCCLMSQYHGGKISFYRRLNPNVGGLNLGVVVPLCANCLNNLSFPNGCYIKITKDEAITFQILED